MKTLNIIGCGHVAKTLAYLWKVHSVLTIQDVLTQTQESADKAVDFIGAGRAISSIENMRPADIFLLATPDDSIHTACLALSRSGLLVEGNIIFQCSGSLPSAELIPLVAEHIHVGSAHPIKSFAQPETAIHTFKDCYCALEGSELAVEQLHSFFTDIGAQPIAIDPHEKTHYHAANVIVCNYLTSLIELGLNVYQKAGISNDTAMCIMKPLLKDTLDNNFNLGTIKALTGPIARGDSKVVSRQIRSLSDWQPETAELYKSLGRIALELSKKQGTASFEDIEKLTTLLTANDSS